MVLPDIEETRETTPASERTQIDCTQDTVRVKQSEAEGCDINVMMKRWQSGGVPPVPSGHEAYGDFSSVGTYIQALDAVMQAEQTFNRLPSEVRTRFENDPALLIDFMHDPENEDEARELGLLEPIPDPTPDPEPPAPPDPGPEPG